MASPLMMLVTPMRRRMMLAIAGEKVEPPRSLGDQLNGTKVPGPASRILFA